MLRAKTFRYLPIAIALLVLGSDGIAAYQPYYGYGYSNYYSGSRSNGPIISLELDEKKSRDLELRIAARENQFDDLIRLLVDGADVNGKSEEGETPLMNAARACAYQSARILLQKHANVNERDLQGRTALMFAVMEGCLSVTKLIIDKPETRLNLKDDAHLSALNYAYQGISLDVDGPSVEILRILKRALKHWFKVRFPGAASLRRDKKSVE